MWGFTSNPGSSSSGGGSFLAALTSKTSDYSMTELDHGGVFDNTGASAAVQYTLPDPDETKSPTMFINSSGYTLRLKAKAGHQIFQGALSTLAAGSIQSLQKGEAIILKGNGSHWNSISPIVGKPWQIDQVALDQSWLFADNADYAENTSMSTAAKSICSTASTILVWFRAQESMTGTNYILDSTDGNGIMIATQNAGTYHQEILIQVPFSTSPGRWIIPNTGWLTRKGWTCVVITYDGSNTANDAAFYVNGERVFSSESTTPSGTVSTTATGYTLGTQNTHVNNALASMFQFAYWDKTLSKEEIKLVSEFGKHVPACAIARDNCVLNYCFGGHPSDAIATVLKNAAIPGTDDLTTTSLTSTQEQAGVVP